MGKVAERFGDLFTIRTHIFGTQVFSTDPAIIQTLFTGDPDVLEAGKANSSAPLLTGKTSVLVLDGAPHKRARRLLMPPFHGERMHAYAEDMRTIAERVASEWPTDKVFPLLPSFQRIALEVIVANVFGLSDGPRRELFANRLKAMIDRAGSPAVAFFVIESLQRDLGPLWPWRRLKAQLDDLNALIFEEIANRRKILGPTEVKGQDDILSLLLKTRDDEGNPMGEQEIRDQLMTLLIAGHETTAISLAWAFERILSHPAVHERILGEIEAARAEGKTSAANLADLPYLDATIKEVLRQRATVPMLGRKLSRAMKFREYELPAGTMVSAAVHLTHNHPKVYSNPEEFRPERFLGQKIDPYSYFPFGGGPRRCLGAAFAMQEIKVVVASLLPKYKVELSPPGPLEFTPRSIFLAPKGGTKVRLMA